MVLILLFAVFVVSYLYINGTISDNPSEDTTNTDNIYVSFNGINAYSPEEELKKKSGDVADAYLVVVGITEDENVIKIADEIVRKLNNDAILIYPFFIKGNEDNIVTFMKEAEADLYIGIECSVIEENKNIATTAVYNPDYFIPEHNSATLAQSLLEKTVGVTNDIPGEIVGCDNNDVILKEATFPAATIKLGYRKLINRNLNIYEDSYADNVSNAIVNVILEERENK